MIYPKFFDNVLLAKREKLFQEGINPYPYDFKISHKISEIIKSESELTGHGEVVKIAGRVWALRSAGKAFFLDIKDSSSKIQAYFKKSAISDKDWKLLTEYTDIGDYIYLSGSLFRTRMNELTIDANKLKMLCKSTVRLPVGKETAEETFNQVSDPEIKYRERYIYWNVDDEARELIIKRSKIISLIRQWMTNEGFLEVETPTIEMVYGGAEARPFETNIWALNRQKAYLRISPELYLKRYIAGGFDKVFTICKNFRNEGIDKSHNPEFSMMEWYETGTDYESQMKRFESLVEFLVKELHGTTKVDYQGNEIDFKTPWERLSVVEAIKKFVDIDVENQTRDELDAFLRSKEVNIPDDLTKGILISFIFEEFCEEHLIQPTFIIDHPIDISPLTKIKRGNPNFVERFEPFVNAMEIGNAYSELTDPVEQYERLAGQRNGSDDEYEDHPIDYDFIKATGIGMPPTGGVGLGIDRVIMLLTNAKSIRDIIAFPMMKPKES